MSEKFINAADTVDMLVEREEKILLIKRKHEPFQDCWALPGGFLDCGEESLEQAAVRELKEETCLTVLEKDLRLLGNYSEPNRDPRGHVISHAYVVTKYSGEPQAADDAKELDWFSLNDLPSLAFDHDKIIGDYKKWKIKN